MTDYLITSESFVKNTTPIFDNIGGKYIQTAIREAQEVRIKGVLGSALLGKLKILCKSGDISKDGNEAYKELLDRCQMATAYQAISELARITSYKITNKGVVKTNDDRVENATESEIIRTQDFYQSKADFYIYELQKFLLDRRTDYPELSVYDCASIRANLHSAASCGLWLGGARGKKVR